MRGTRRMRAFAGVVAVALVLGACGGDDEGNGGGGGGTTGDTGGDTTGATDGGSGTAITIEGFAFNPATLDVSGETTLTVTNNDDAAHTFTLDDGSVDEEIGAGESVEVTVNPSATTGFHCEFHPQMTGTLEVA